MTWEIVIRVTPRETFDEEDFGYEGGTTPDEVIKDEIVAALDAIAVTATVVSVKEVGDVD